MRASARGRSTRADKEIVAATMTTDKLTSARRSTRADKEIVAGDAAMQPTDRGQPQHPR